MSTQDGQGILSEETQAALAELKDEEVLAPGEEATQPAPQQVDVDSTEVAEETSVATEVDEDSGEEPQAQDARQLTPDSVRAIEKLANKSHEEKVVKIRNMLSDTRQHNKDAAKHAMELYGISELEVTPQPQVQAQPQAQSAITATELGLTPEDAQELLETVHTQKKYKTISSLAGDYGLEIDPQVVANDSEFLRQYLAPGMENKTIKERTELAFHRTYSKDRSYLEQNSKRAEKKARAASAGVPTVGTATAPKKEFSPFDRSMATMSIDQFMAT